MIFHGAAIDHWRDTFLGDDFGQIFMNFVRADGAHRSQALHGRHQSFPRALVPHLDLLVDRVTTVAIGRAVVVVDDAMDPSVFGTIGQELALGRFESVHAHGWDKARRLVDGAPLRGGPVYYDPTGVFDRPGARYPTSSVVDDWRESIWRS
ncbi:MAG: hypothetical protein ABIR34_08600 [Marmoricola sp.]